MTTITNVKIRATITTGGLSVETPYILSFSVNKQRNNKSTFSASLKVKGTDLSTLSDNEIVIKAGSSGSQRVIFTGYILSSKPSPCWDDPSYVILNLSGSDILYKLENKKFTRRQINPESKWASIEGVNRKAIVNGSFKLINQPITLIAEDYVHDEEKLGSNLPSDMTRLAQTRETPKDRAVIIEVSNMKTL